jgi:hypothetical protein
LVLNYLSACVNSEGGNRSSDHWIMIPVPK